MHAGSLKFFKNAFSNLVTGGAASIPALALPYFFVRDFTQTEFSLWVLILQLAAYVNYLDFGVQVAIGRFVAHGLGSGDRRKAEDIASAGLQVLTVVAAIAFLLMLLVARLLPDIFPKIHPAMIGTARSMLCWIGGALALGLPFTAYMGVFVGLQRNDIPAMLQLFSKGGLGLVLIWVAGRTHNLDVAAETYFAVCVVGYLAQYASFKILCPQWRLRLVAGLGRAHREVISYCASLTVWQLMMLLVGGVDITIVGIFDFKSVAAYGVALNLIAFFIGLFRAAVTPVLQIFAKLHARNETSKLLGLLDLSTYAMTVCLFVVGCWMILPSPLLYRLWVGPEMALVSVPIFSVLILGNAIRSTASVYANYLVAVGQQQRVYLGPIAEGFSNLAASVIGAAMFGAIGVAWGTVLGAIVGVSANIFYNFGRTMPAEFLRWRFLRHTLAEPILLAMPMIAVCWASRAFALSLVWSVPAMALASVPSLIRAWQTYRRALRLLRPSASDSPRDEAAAQGSLA